MKVFYTASKHVPHLDVEVAEFAVVLFVEGCGPVDAEDEVVVHGELETAASTEMEVVESGIIVERRTLGQNVGTVNQLVGLLWVFVNIVVWLHHHAGIEEGIETHIELVLAHLEFK